MQNTSKILIEQAQAILRQNDRGGYTVPTARLYPFQWNWDSAICAMGWQQFDEPRAWQEIDRLLEGQWVDGMIPHIIFHKESPDYFPGADVWGVPDGCLQNGKRLPRTSGISQPPVLASCVRRLWEHSRTPQSQKARMPRLCKQMLAWHRWWWSARDPGNSGLVCIYHPWESGMDNSPAWDGALQRVLPLQNPSYQRRDTLVVDLSYRPHQSEYDRYMALVELFRGYEYAQQKLYEASPFRVLDVGTNAILQQANQDLLALVHEFGSVQEVRELEERIKLTHSVFAALWDEELGLYLSHDEISETPIRVPTSSGFLPIFAGLPTKRQVARMAAEVQRWAECCEHLIPSTSPFHPCFESKRYWRGPVWPHINWIIAQGFEKYEYTNVANRIRESTISLISKNGFQEYYDPHTSEGCGGSSFSWTAAIALLCFNR